MIYAGFWKRAAAFILDALVIWVIMAILLLVAFFPQILAFLLGGLYHVVFETSPLRATPGKALMKIAVLKADGRQLTIKDSIIRYALSWVSGMFLCLGYFIALFTDKKQTFHDLVAETVVVEETFAEHNFWQIFVAQFKVIFSTDKGQNNPAEKRVDSQSLEELYNLYQKGILTEEEYKSKKEEYLKKL
jgi:uncharacterized RDD family membrane protein YckC